MSEDKIASLLLRRSLDIKELAKALALAQGEFPVIPKDSEVKVYSKPPGRDLLYTYKYADLTTIIASVRPALTKHGLSFTQSYAKDPDLGFGFDTTIMHKSGQWIRSGFVPGEIPKNTDMKSVAGFATYGKRISISAALGVSAEEDMDAPPDKGESMEKTQGPDHPQGGKKKFVPSKPKDGPGSTTAHGSMPPPPLPDDDIDKALGSHPPGSVEAAGDYVIQFGPYKGKKISFLSAENLDKYCTALNEQAIREEKSIDPNGPVGELFENARIYLGRV